jgi:hypothetical protein
MTRTLHSAAWRTALLLAVFTVGGCYAYRPVALAPAPQSRVRIVFTSALVLSTLPFGQDSTRHTYSGVLEASGTIRAAAGDSVALLLDEVRTAHGSVINVAGQTALLPTAQIARIEERRFQAGTTALAGLGAAALALAAYILVIIAAITKSF